MEPNTFVTLRILAPLALASLTALSVSIVSPDWLTASTAVSLSTRSRPSSENSDATTTRASIPPSFLSAKDPTSPA